MVRGLNASAFSRAARSAQQKTHFGARIQRRYASDHGHGHGHGHPEVNESMGSGFWIAAASIPATALVYTLAQPASGADEDKLRLTRLIEWYEDDLRAKWVRGNDIRSQYIDKAREEGNVLMNTTRSDWVDLKYPEVLNSGSPFNVSPGHYANMDKVAEHYKNVNAAAQAEISRKE